MLPYNKPSITFVSDAPNLVAGDANGVDDSIVSNWQQLPSVSVGD